MSGKNYGNRIKMAKANTFSYTKERRKTRLVYLYVVKFNFTTTKNVASDINSDFFN